MENRPENRSADTVKDPVCGMQVAPDRAADSSEYDGREYYFCSTACKDQFEKSPERYAEKRSAQG